MGQHEPPNATNVVRMCVQGWDVHTGFVVSTHTQGHVGFSSMGSALVHLRAQQDVSICGFALREPLGDSLPERKGHSPNDGLQCMGALDIAYSAWGHSI